MKEFNLEKYLDICFEKNEYYLKMLDLIKNNNEIKGEMHHIIPRSYFRKFNIDIVNNGNTVLLSPKNHYLAHYYAWKCSKSILINEMRQAYWFMSNKLISEKLIDKAEEYELIKEEISRINSKKIICLDDGIIYNSKREASRKLNIDRKSLLDVLKETNISVKGKHFSMYDDKYLVEQNRLNKIQELENRRNNIKIICLETKKIFNSISECEDEYLIEHSLICNAINNKSISAGNLHFEKYDLNTEYSDKYCKLKIENLESKRKNIKHDNKKKSLICIELNKEFKSISEALRFLGKTNNGKFNKWLKEREIIYGYHWKIY